MKYRRNLKILLILGILFSFVTGISENGNQLSAIILGLLYAGLLIIEHFLFNRNEIPEKTDFKLGLSEVREVADTTEQLPIRLNSMIIAEGEIPDWIVMAGGAPMSFPISFTSFQVVYEDMTIIIECPFNKTLFDKFCRFKLLGIRGKYYDEENYETMQRALLDAKYIVATHEHWDHVGGIAQSSNVKELIKKTVLTKEQINGHTIKDAGFPEGILDEVSPLEYDKYHVLAPGVVLIKTPGHSVGSQTIYVRLRNGEEFLFIGDIGWNRINIEKLVNHSRMGAILRYENREQLGHQIKWLHDNIYDNEGENIHLITSHDPSQIEEYTRAKLMGTIFE